MTMTGLYVRIPLEKQPLIKRVCYRMRDDAVFYEAAEKLLNAVERADRGSDEIIRRARTEAAERLLEDADHAA